MTQVAARHATMRGESASVHVAAAAKFGDKLPTVWWLDRIARHQSTVRSSWLLLIGLPGHDVGLVPFASRMSAESSSLAL